MATLQEIYDRRNDSALRNRVHAACLLEAKVIVMEGDTEPSHTERLAWAKRFLAGGTTAQQAAQQMLEALIAASPDATYTDDADIVAAVGLVATKLALMG